MERRSNRRRRLDLVEKDKRTVGKGKKKKKMAKDLEGSGGKEQGDNLNEQEEGHGECVEAVLNADLKVVEGEDGECQGLEEKAS